MKKNAYKLKKSSFRTINNSGKSNADIIDQESKDIYAIKNANKINQKANVETEPQFDDNETLCESPVKGFTLKTNRSILKVFSSTTNSTQQQTAENFDTFSNS